MGGWVIAAVGAGGRWTPGIGDPTPLGWLTVGAYLAAAALCLRARRRAGFVGGPALRRFWLLLALVLLVLGVNKQLDLQTGLTQLGRRLARTQGWYGVRREVQLVFLAALALAAAAASLGLLAVARRFAASVRVAALGLALLSLFVVARASSFHHLDRLLGHPLLGVRTSAALELLGIGLVAAAAWRFHAGAGAAARAGPAARRPATGR